MQSQVPSPWGLRGPGLVVHAAPWRHRSTQLCSRPGCAPGLRRRGANNNNNNINNLSNNFGGRFGEVLCATAVAVVALRASSWRLDSQGRDAWEIEGWPCSKSARKRSGHPAVSSDLLRRVVAEAGLGEEVGLGADNNDNDNNDNDKKNTDFAARLRGLMRGALARSDALLASDALRVLHRLLRRKGLCIPEAEFNNVAEALVQRAVLLRCPTEDLLEAELQAAGMFSGGSLGAAALARSNEEQMARLVKELLPQWLAGGTADGASERRLRLAADCWERCGPRGDLDGAGLFAAICFELREVSRAAPYIQEVRTFGVDLRLAYQPSFLEDLVEYGLVTADAVSQGSDSCGLPALVQQAAAVARQGELLGVARRRHGALLLRRGDGTAGNTKYEVLATGFNHAATPLGPKGVDQRTGKVRTFPSLSEAAAGGLNLQSRKIRPAQRHAEVHCLLQLPRLKHDALGTEILIVEIADVGPSLGWAEPCSRGCLQLLLKMGVSKAHFTDGQGCLVERHLTHTPDLDVPYKTFARRTSDCVISERAWLDIQEKLRQ
ncbi:unnamed protein product, partial [Polarella glacialis]